MDNDWRKCAMDDETAKKFIAELRKLTLTPNEPTNLANKEYTEEFLHEL